MEFRAPSVATEQNTNAIKYLTKNLEDPEVGRRVLDGLMQDLGNAVEGFPDWHPILTIPQQGTTKHVSWFSQLETYDATEHTVEFVRGFITCPYSEDQANQLLDAVNQLTGLHAYRLPGPLYADNAYPVVVVATEVKLEADGTIRSRDALTWFAQQSVKEAWDAQVAETWWNIRSLILGRPHGSRSSLFVNQHTGVHMRKILEALNNSGMFGPIRESSLDMLSKKKQDKISETLIRTAVTNWDKCSEKFSFELRGEICKVDIRDTWDDGHELSIRIEIGEYDLYASGFYYEEDDRITHSEPRGKRALAEKFL
ncbi:MAG: hypothetical protein E2O92_04190 [Alphaproteobacteria bacterium]|nr:MAG: hypothetical protein E2O92_04190 [Alphaproteobacteria bacterium]